MLLERTALKLRPPCIAQSPRRMQFCLANPVRKTECTNKGVELNLPLSDTRSNSHISVSTASSRIGMPKETGRHGQGYSTIFSSRFVVKANYLSFFKVLSMISHIATYFQPWLSLCIVPLSTSSGLLGTIAASAEKSYRTDAPKISHHASIILDSAKDYQSRKLLLNFCAGVIHEWAHRLSQKAIA